MVWFFFKVNWVRVAVQATFPSTSLYVDQELRYHLHCLQTPWGTKVKLLVNLLESMWSRIAVPGITALPTHSTLKPIN